MTLEQVGIIVSIIIGVIGILTSIHSRVVTLAKIEVKVDTMWDFTLRRGWGELVEKGQARMNSPLVLNADARAWMATMSTELRAFYARLGRRMSDRELAIEIERKYGDEILKKVCIPNGISAGACLIIALEVAREVIDEEKPTTTP